MFNWIFIYILHIFRPMNTWNTGHYAQPVTKPPVFVRPSQDQLQKIALKYLDKMNILWIEYYKEYAQQFHSDITKFVYPTPEEILEEFGNALKFNRRPELPKPVMIKSNVTYGDFKRIRDSEYGDTMSIDNEFQNKRPRSDNGWGEECSSPAYSTNSFNKENGSGWKNRDNWNGDRGRGRGRGRGGSFRGGRNNNNRFDSRNSNDGFGAAAKTSSGWSDDEDSAPKATKADTPTRNNEWDNDDDGWGDKTDNAPPQKPQSANIQSADTEWDDDPPTATQPKIEAKKDIAVKPSNDDDWEDEPKLLNTSLTQDSDALFIDTQRMTQNTQSQAIKAVAGNDDDWD